MQLFGCLYLDGVYFRGHDLSGPIIKPDYQARIREILRESISVATTQLRPLSFAR